MSNALTLSPLLASFIRDSLLEVPSIKEARVTYYTIGKPSIGITVSFDSQEDCPNKILQNGRHRVFMLHHDGELVSLAGWKVAKFRASRVKNVEEAAAKLVKWATEKALEA